MHLSDRWPPWCVTKRTMTRFLRRQFEMPWKPWPFSKQPGRVRRKTWLPFERRISSNSSKRMLFVQSMPESLDFFIVYRELLSFHTIKESIMTLEILKKTNYHHHRRSLRTSVHRQGCQPANNWDRLSILVASWINMLTCALIDIWFSRSTPCNFCRRPSSNRSAILFVSKEQILMKTWISWPSIDKPVLVDSPAEVEDEAHDTGVDSGNIVPLSNDRCEDDAAESWLVLSNGCCNCRDFWEESGHW